MSSQDSSSALDQIRARYLELNGNHPMTETDDLYVRTHYVPLPESAYDDVLAHNLPLPSYLLSDGTPMVPRDYLDVIELAGGPGRIGHWFAEHFVGQDSARTREELGHYLSGRYVCLRSVTPTTILQKERWGRQIEDGLARLARLTGRPGDTVARGLLGEATAALDGLLTEMTDHDRLRFGGPTVKARLVNDIRRDHLLPRPPELPIRTERLVLRRSTPADAEAYHAYHCDPEVDRFLLGEPWTLARCRDELGRHDDDDPRITLFVERDGEVIGDVMIAPQGPSYCQVELGWVFSTASQGHGYATEAATAALGLAFSHYGAHRVYAQLDARNAASARLCERLGMRHEVTRLGDYWSRGEWTDSLEYGVLAEEYAARER